MKNLLILSLSVFIFGCPERDMNINMKNSPISIGQDIQTQNQSNTKKCTKNIFYECLNNCTTKFWELASVFPKHSYNHCLKRCKYPCIENCLTPKIRQDFGKEKALNLCAQTCLE